ncbi:hypothetical protein, partial [Paraburkholderia sp.]|uniref:hypothetical protein n=1 Tax=Paraburkholderia sp. TaxID=1926495 RepID=UPI002B497E76
MAANTDFLEVAGIASYRPKGWPVSRERRRQRHTRRFKEYFERHPVAMLIFDVNSLEILTANTAAQRQ